MCNPIKKRNNSSQAGFTLIEIAIGLILMGLVLIPSITLYMDFKKNKDWIKTEEHIRAVESKVGGFNSNYGRYPCPASMTAVRGAANYGFELANCLTNAPATGTCAGGICAYNNGGSVVLVGAVPFKNLNLLEEQAYDAYNMKFSYAVTLDLTDTSTFTVNGGAIGIVSADDTTRSALGIPDSAHYIVISHGPNRAGAFSATTVQIPCTDGSAVEQENCDADAVFVTGEISQNYDDRTAFFDGVLPTEWKKQTSTSNDIFLKDSNSIALGAANTTNLNAADNVLVRNVGSGTGTAISETSYFVERLCEFGAAANGDCFEPSLLAGDLTDDGTRLLASGGNGISCYDGTNDEFLVGIQNGAPVCSDEIFLSCPDASRQFISGIDSDGNLKCTTEPDDECLELNTTNFCGGAVSIPAGTPSGGNAFAYSGECRMFPGTITDTSVSAEVQSRIDTALAGNPGNFPAAMIQARNSINLYMLGLRFTARDIVQCEDVTSSPPGLVRDTYRCDDGGWSVLSTHEIRGNSSFPGNVTLGGTWPAENSYGGADISNNNEDHDCWCREDYRAIFDSSQSCPSTVETGMRVRIQKHRCPRTDHNWNTIYDQRWLFCGCADGTEDDTPSCNAYYDTVNGTTGTTGLTGVVRLTYTTSCNGSGILVRDPGPPTTINTTECACAGNSPNYERDYCPSGQTNSWTSPFGNETGVTEIREQPWICPATTSGGLPDPGYYGGFSTVTGLTIPACTCDPALVTARKDCPDGELGLGIFYDAPQDCATGDPVADETLWVEKERFCTGCEWVTTGAPSTTEFALGPEPKSSCSCGSPSEDFCSQFSSLGEYDTWSPCQCTPKL